MERKHKQVTSVATSVTNLSHHEHSVHQELLSGQLHRLKMPLPQVPCLETMRMASKKLQCFLHQQMHIHVAKQVTAATFFRYQMVAARLCEMSSWSTMTMLTGTVVKFGQTSALALPLIVDFFVRAREERFKSG